MIKMFLFPVIEIWLLFLVSWCFQYLVFVFVHFDFCLVPGILENWNMKYFTPEILIVIAILSIILALVAYYGPKWFDQF